SLLAVQFALEDSMMEIAQETGEKAILFCDRGALDYAAYAPEAAWQALLDERGWTIVSLCQRYHAVIHMMTAALGSESSYTLSNNAARHETLEQARAVDERLRQAWTGHPYFDVIDNRGDFQDKVRRVVEAACHRVGERVPGRLSRRFLVRPCSSI